MTMKRIAPGVKNYATVKDWEDPLYTLTHVPVPQLEMTSIFFSPFLVKEKYQIKALMNQATFLHRVTVYIYMNR